MKRYLGMFIKLLVIIFIGVIMYLGSENSKTEGKDITNIKLYIMLFSYIGGILLIPLFMIIFKKKEKI